MVNSFASDSHNFNLERLLANARFLFPNNIVEVVVACDRNFQDPMFPSGRGDSCSYAVLVDKTNCDEPNGFKVLQCGPEVWGFDPRNAIESLLAVTARAVHERIEKVLHHQE